jgi:hypothetical protein
MIPSTPAPLRPKVTTVRVALLITAILSVASLFVAATVGDNSGDLLGAASFLVCFTGIWCLGSWRYHRGTILDPYGLFFLAAFVFNGGQAPLHLIGALDRGYLHGDFTDGAVTRTLFLVTASLTALHAGALSALAAAHRRPPRPHEDDSEVASRSLVGWSLLIASIGPLVYMLYNGVTRVLTYGYMALYQDYTPAGIESAVQIIALLVVPGSMFVISTAQRKTVARWIPFAVLLAYGVTLLFLGLRGHSTLPLVAAAWLWHRAVKPLPKAPLIGAAALLMLVVFPAVRVIRQSAGSDRASTDLVASGYASIDNPAIAIFNELGMSMNTVAYTIDLVPKTRDFELGASYGYSALTLFPSLFWDRHPAIEHGTPSTWLVNTVDPVFAAIGGGMGYSFIAEAFLNFGWLAPLLIAFIGAAWVHMWWSAERAGVAALCALAAFLPSWLFYARADSSILPRALLWYAFAPYLAQKWIAQVLRRTPEAGRAHFHHR